MFLHFQVKNKEKKRQILLAKKKQAAEVSVGKFLTDEDFKRIEAAQLSKQISSLKTKAGVKRKAEDEPER